MADVITGLLVVILSLAGAVSLIKFLIFRFYRSKEDKTIMLITPAFNSSDDIEYALRSCAAKVRWMGKVRPYRVICLDKGMDKTTREICARICSEYDFITIMDTEQLNRFFEESKHNMNNL